MKWNQHQKMGFRCTLSYFMATYRNLLCRYCRLWSLFVSLQLKNWFFDSKRLCQQIKHRFVVCILFCSDEFKYRYNASNLYRVTHDDGG